MGDSEQHIFLTIPDEMEGYRLDKALSELIPDYSRATIQQWVRDEHVQFNGQSIKQKTKMSAGDTLEISIPTPEPANWIAENIPLDIVYEDDAIMVINKPAGLVVHPGAGNTHGTLLNGLLFHNDSLRLLPRGGIVHRLDKDTTGLMVTSKTEQARQHLIDQLKDHSMFRQYLACINGVPVAGETIDQPIARHRQDRLRMAVVRDGKPAVTHIRIRQKFRSHTLVEAQLETGRTHQIRVHMSWRNFPLIGDSLYGRRLKIPPAATPEFEKTLRSFNRQALHACQLSLTHPVTEETMVWEQALPADMEHLVSALQNDLTSHGLK